MSAKDPSRFVWLFARPLSWAFILGVESVSNGVYPLCHWGVLVTRLSPGGTLAFLAESIVIDSQDLGTMWELLRGERDKVAVNVTRPFTVSKARNEWMPFQAEQLGTTILTDEQIQNNAIRITQRHTDYRLFENNCQNFAKYLFQSICLEPFTPQTITSILQRLFSTHSKPHNARRWMPIPGGWPESLGSTSLDSRSFYSATTSLSDFTEEIWFTAEPNTETESNSANTFQFNNLSPGLVSLLQNDDMGNTVTVSTASSCLPLHVIIFSGLPVLSKIRAYWALWQPHEEGSEDGSVFWAKRKGLFSNETQFTRYTFSQRGYNKLLVDIPLKNVRISEIALLQSCYDVSRNRKFPLTRNSSRDWVQKVIEHLIEQCMVIDVDDIVKRLRNIRVLKATIVLREEPQTHIEPIQSKSTPSDTIATSTLTGGDARKTPTMPPERTRLGTPIGNTSRFSSLTLNALTPTGLDDIIQRLLTTAYIAKITKSFSLGTDEIISLCQDARKLFLAQSTLIELIPPVTIVGNVHGQFGDLIRLFEMCGWPPKRNYLFLGNYVDRGRQSLETVCLLFALKLRWPENFFLLRGNHECANISRVHGFYDECKRRTSIKIWKTFIDVFNCLPIASIVASKIFCVHGGLSPSLDRIDDIRQIARPTDVPDYGLLNDLLWSDPRDTEADWEDNERGVSYTFGRNVINEFLDKFEFDLVCRAHVVEDGYEFFNGRTLVTLVSAPNYCGEFGNWGAVMSVNEELLYSFELLKPLNASDVKAALRQSRKNALH